MTYIIYDKWRLQNPEQTLKTITYWWSEACIADCILALFGVESPDYLSYIVFSKLVYAEVSKTTSASKRVFHQTVHAQNSMLTKEIHDQGKLDKFSVLTYLNKP